jgi:hypothetical protein
VFFRPFADYCEILRFPNNAARYSQAIKLSSSHTFDHIQSKLKAGL